MELSVTRDYKSRICYNDQTHGLKIAGLNTRTTQVYWNLPRT